MYAAGDVAEWQGRVYGIVLAAREQALVAAQNMVEPQSARYAGTPPAQRLKVAGVDLLVLGDTQPLGGPYTEERVEEKDRYAKFVLNEKRILVGAIVLGYPELMRAAEELFRSGTLRPRTCVGNEPLGVDVSTGLGCGKLALRAGEDQQGPRVQRFLRIAGSAILVGKGNVRALFISPDLSENACAE